MTCAAAVRCRIVARFERSIIGRLAISVGVVILLLAQVGTHLPTSALARVVAPPAARAVNMLAWEQTWAVFAPNPRSISLDLEATVTFADGSTARWTVPDGPVVGANLRLYRWRKWLENVRADDSWLLWDPTARWIASLYRNGPSPVVRVDLTRLFHENLAEGPQPPWRAYTFYSLDLSTAAR